jgi:hypothetical protein
MYLTSVYLYPNKIEVFTNSLVSSQPERYHKVYNRNLKVYRGVDNRIEVRVKNGDQRSSNIGETALVFTMVVADTQRLVLVKDCVVRDSTQGIAYVDLSREDLLKLEEGSYRYNLTLEYREAVTEDEYRVTKKSPLYVDSQFGAISNIDVVNDVNGHVSSSLEIDEFSFTNPFTLGEQNNPFFISSIVDAKPKTSTPKSVHTFQFYFDNFQGTVEIQGSLEPQGATPNEWTVIKSFEYTGTGTDYENVIGKYNWFRIKYLPTNYVMSMGEKLELLGKLDKVLYR